MDDAARHHHVLHLGQALLDLGQSREELGPAHLRPVIVDLQRADAGGEVDEAGELGLRHRLGHQVGAQAQADIELHVAELDQEVVVPLPAIDHLDRAVVMLGDDGGAGLLRRADHGGAGDGILRPLQGHKAHLVAGLELAHLPLLVAGDHRRADEAAERRAIRAEDDGHVAGKVDGADGIGVVVEIGGVEPRLAAIGARPAGRRPHEPHARAGAVVVHLVGGREQIVDVGVLEEVRRAVGAVDDADLPRPRERRRGDGHGLGHGRAFLRRGEVEGIAGLERAGGMAAELAQGESGARAQHLGRLEGAAHRQIGALARSLDGADGEHLSRFHGEGRVVRHLHAVQLRRHEGAGKGDGRRRVEAQGRAVHRHFQGAGGLVIAH